MLKPGSATVPRATFMAAMGDSLYHFSQLYVQDKLDDPQKMGTLLQRAQGALAGVPESKETKDLKRQIDAASGRPRGVRSTAP